jgi:hypothetical protein
MNTGRPVFAQLMSLIHPEVFHRCVDRFQSQEHLRSFSCWDQFLCMAFSQLTFRDSLRDTVDCLCARSDRLYQMGFRGPIRRSTLADANEQRDWRIYAQLAQTLIRRARRLYANETLAMDLDATAYALDSTTIDLCLNLFRWAKFRRAKGAIKLHTLLDLRGPIPTFIHISDGKLHDVNALDLLPIEPGSFYVMDRGYLDFERLHTFQDLGAFFVIRAKRSLKYVRLKSQEIVDSSTGVRTDQIIRLKTFYSRKGYPDRLHRIRYFDAETQRFFVYLTNNFTLPPLTIALLYKSRWQTESPDQELFRHVSQRCQDAGLDCCVRLCDGRDPQKRTEPVGESPPNSPKFERQRIRESSNRSTTYKTASPTFRRVWLFCI